MRLFSQWSSKSIFQAFKKQELVLFSKRVSVPCHWSIPAPPDRAWIYGRFSLADAPRAVRREHRCERMPLPPEEGMSLSQDIHQSIPTISHSLLKVVIGVLPKEPKVFLVRKNMWGQCYTQAHVKIMATVIRKVYMFIMKMRRNSKNSYRRSGGADRVERSVLSEGGYWIDLMMKLSSSSIRC